MKLKRVTGRVFTCTCVGCGRNMHAGDWSDDNAQPETVYADLDGRAFVDYYCAACVGGERTASHVVRAQT